MILAVVYLIFINIPPYTEPSSVRREDPVEVKLYQSPASYDVESTVLLNEASRRDKEVSYVVKAQLDVVPVWDERLEFILKFELNSPQLYARGKHPNAEYAPLKSVWDSSPHSTFFAHLHDGRVSSAYLDSDDSIDIQNFKRSLISLFQFKILHEETNETDISGICHVMYEILSTTTIRKTKRACASAGWAQTAADDVRSRRVLRYELGAAGELRRLHAEELHELGTGNGDGLKARALLVLARRANTPPPSARAPSAAAALAGQRATSAPLAAPAPVTPPDIAHLELSDDPPVEPQAPATDEVLLEAAQEAWAHAAGDGGTLREARAAHRALAAVRAATPSRLAALLHDRADPRRLAGICTALGLAGDEATHAAAVRFLRLRERDAPHELAHAYFAALALAARPQDSVVEDALKLADEIEDARLADAAMLAAAAAASRASPRASRRVRDRLLAALGRCSSDDCGRGRLAALANLRRADTAEVLLEQAERGADGALDALDALQAAGVLPSHALPRLEALALGSGPLERRAVALDVLLRALAEAPLGSARVLLALKAQGARELLRLAWLRLDALAEVREDVRPALMLLPAHVRGWEARATGGTSALLVREAGRAGGWAALLTAHTAAANGLLRRARVSLQLLAPDNATDDTLSVQLWTRGLGALAGAEGDDEDSETVGGGLTLSVGAAGLPPITLFDGRADLLGHVWAGTASEPTPVLRAIRTAGGARASVPVMGGAALHYARSALGALALDAHATLSLWARSARGHLALRGSVSARAAAAVRTSWGALAAITRSELEARLHIAADLDFYDGVTLCVRAHTDAHRHDSATTLGSALGVAQRRVLRRRTRSVAGEGRTLALGAPNDAACRAFGAEV